jgi:hypothetical protein
MAYKGMLAAIGGAIAVLAFTGCPSDAGERMRDGAHRHYNHADPATKRYHRKRGVRVRGYLARGGYYSYNDADVVNVYGGSRALFGSTNAYRDPFTDRQSIAGPFDHGFFFDSGIGPRGGDAPYPK